MGLGNGSFGSSTNYTVSGNPEPVMVVMILQHIIVAIAKYHY
jgi:hypothetical protein